TAGGTDRLASPGIGRREDQFHAWVPRNEITNLAARVSRGAEHADRNFIHQECINSHRSTRNSSDISNEGLLVSVQKETPQSGAAFSAHSSFLSADIPCDRLALHARAVGRATCRVRGADAGFRDRLRARHGPEASGMETGSRVLPCAGKGVAANPGAHARQDDA